MKVGLDLFKEIFLLSKRHASIVVQVRDDYWTPSESQLSHQAVDIKLVVGAQSTGFKHLGPH